MSERFRNGKDLSKSGQVLSGGTKQQAAPTAASIRSNINAGWAALLGLNDLLWLKAVNRMRDRPSDWKAYLEIATLCMKAG